MKVFLRLFFRLLYHQFAFTYDLVAAAVSFNRWKDWLGEVIPFIEGVRVLELGHGPGHLQRILLSRGLAAVAIDESSHMGLLARRNTRGSARLVRGLAQTLPFGGGAFDSIVSTFPTEYIFDPVTLSEARRCLSDGGRLIVLPVAKPKNRFLEWLYRVMGESPADADEVVKRKLLTPFTRAGFQTELKIIDVQSSRLFIILARRTHVEQITGTG
jgi:ubiquinone/menaquinone biosynthesis C-methylase UbiE